MSEYKEFSGKTVEDAITAACESFVITSEKLDYEIIDSGSNGFLGIGSKPAIIKARLKSDSVVSEKPVEVKPEVKTEVVDNIKKEEKEEKKNIEIDEDTVKKEAEVFLNSVFSAMGIDAQIKTDFSKNDAELSIELAGDSMGVLIGKRGQTLDSLQYLTSLVVNKGTSSYIRVKVDTEDYRRRRKETLENLAKNLSYKVKRTRRSVSLEPMNPYERRIIHSVLQGDRFVTTHSEGDEPYRRVVITPKKDYRKDNKN